jgi:hypothetical protein
MKTLSFVAATLICGFVIYMAELQKSTLWGLKNCELSEISPDFTPQEKANCRIMKGNK